MIRFVPIRNPKPTTPRDLYTRVPFQVNAKLLGEMISLGLMGAYESAPDDAQPRTTPA